MRAEKLHQTDLYLVPHLQPDGWADIQPAYDYYTKSSFCFPIKVMIGDSIAGIGTTILHNDVAWLGHIIVHKDFRRRGIGLFITKALVESLDFSGCKTIYLLATEMGAPVYEKAGFETETEYLFFKDINIKANEVNDHIEEYTDRYKEQVAALDGLVSGENRLFHLEEHLQQGFVYQERERIKGFLLPSFGDGLIIAHEPEAGLALLQKRLQSADKLVFPKDNLIASRFLYEKGYREVSTGKRMRLGKKREVQFQHIYNRIGGNLG